MSGKAPMRGGHWRTLWCDHDSLNIGSLAIDPKNPAVIYCGTGEANLSVDSYAGVGIYRTDNSGETWKLLASSDETGVPTRIGVIAIDPFDSKHLRIGGVGANESSARPKDLGGMFASHDGGATWERETFVSKNNYWCHAIVFHPTKRRVIFATFTEQGTKSGIWRSADGGEHWMQLTEGLPAPECFARTSLASQLVESRRDVCSRGRCPQLPERFGAWGFSERRWREKLARNRRETFLGRSTDFVRKYHSRCIRRIRITFCAAGWICT